jgi:hypothetical protein
MFGAKEIQDLIDEIGRACDKAEEAAGAAEDVFGTVDRIRDESDDARCAADETVEQLRNLIRYLVRKQEKAIPTGPDLVMLLGNIEKQLIPLGHAIDEMRRALTTGGDNER